MQPAQSKLWILLSFSPFLTSTLYYIFFAFQTNSTEKIDIPLKIASSWNIEFSLTLDSILKIDSVLTSIVYVHCREEGCIGLYIPDNQEISRGPRNVLWAKPEGHLESRGKSRGRRGCTTHSLIIGREVLILTLYILLALQGCISWYIPRDGLMMREWPYTASNRDELGCTSPLTSRYPLALEMSLGLRPREISWL